MSAVKGKGNKTTERRLRAVLSRSRIAGWTMHPTDVLGKPDFYFPAARLAVFCDGCFWHGCGRCSHGIKRNSSFWRAKIERNRKRDTQTTAKLSAHAVRVLRFWEHELTTDLPGCVRRIRELLATHSPRARQSADRSWRHVHTTGDETA
jgi:DNA mismatch endonuclease (patch repair protein)